MTRDEARKLTEESIRTVSENDGLAIHWDRPGSQDLRDLGITSLGLFELVSVLEERGGFVFDDHDVDSAHFKTLGTVVALLVRYPLTAAEADGVDEVG
jgi:acyl carrier protein